LEVNVTVDSRSLEGPTHYEIGHFIDGPKIAGTAYRWGDVAQPATGEIQARVAFASTDEVDQAIDAGERAFGEW
jgi:malonate-semialdehyde dehydrogenase (acetylating)/methylmalonate-semialdehyde dehydrogenase